jgi:hypothetical protein
MNWSTAPGFNGFIEINPNIATNSALGSNLRVKDIHSLTYNFNLTETGNTNGDTSFDIGLTTVPNSATRAAPMTNEIMVWLHRTNWNPATPIGTYNSKYFSGGIYNGTIISNPASGDPNWNITQFVANTDTYNGQIDLADMLRVLVADGIISPNEYVSWETLGKEVGNGTGSLTVNSFTYNLNGQNNIIYMYPQQTALVGSIADETFALYQSGQPTTLTRTHTVSITLDSTVINNVANTVHFYINGIDEGAQTLSTTLSGYSDSTNVWDNGQTFTFFVPNTGEFSSVKVVIDSPVITNSKGGTSQVSVWRVTVDGVDLTSATYHPLNGNVDHYELNSDDMYNGGYLTLDPTPYNSTLAIQPGTAANPITVDGAGGTDTVLALGSANQYAITKDATGNWHLAENAGLNQNATLTAISNLQFANGDAVSFIPTLVSITNNTAYTPQDVITLSGAANQYAITASNGALTLTDSATNQSIHLANATEIDFSDQHILVTNSVDSAAAEVARLYMATLAREPDTLGLSYWEQMLTNMTPAGQPTWSQLSNIVSGFINSTEFQAKYGNTDNTHFVTLLYNNVLNRAPDSAGLAYWIGNLTSGTETRQQVVLGFSESAEFKNDTTYHAPIVGVNHAPATGWILVG